MIVNSLWHENNLTSALWKEHIPSHKNEISYIRSLFSLISSGTEYLVSTGNVPPQSYRAMKVPYMGGRFQFPVKYGYNLIGVKHTHQNDNILVHCMHPHQDIAAVSEQDINLVPSEIKPRQATLFGTMETVINAIWDARLDEIENEPVMVIGGGLIGVTLATTLKHKLSLDVFLSETHAYRKEKARELGIRVEDNPQDTYPVCFHTSGTSTGLQYAIDRCSYEGKVVEMSWYGSNPVTLHLGHSFHYERKQIISSQVSNIPGHKKDAEDYASRRSLAWSYLEHPIFNELITHEIPFEESPEFFDRIRNRDRDFIGCVIKY